MRVVIYCRASTQDQHIDAQAQPLREWAARRGFVVVEEYTDVGISGSRSSRPGLNRLLADARRRKFDVLAVAALDRVARSLSHMAAFGAELQALGIQLVSLREAVDTGSPTGRALLGMCSVFAELELEILRERTRLGLAAARRRGVLLGRPRALNDEGRALFLQLRAAGKGLRYCAEQLGVGLATLSRELKRA